MRIHVDPDRCQGHSRCYALAPMLFDSDDFGMSTAVNGGLVPEEYVDLARLAIQNCPENAIVVVEGTGHDTVRGSDRPHARRVRTALAGADADRLSEPGAREVFGAP